MEKMDYWRLCDEFSVVQAALLIVGTDPSECDPFTGSYCQKWCLGD